MDLGTPRRGPSVTSRTPVSGQIATLGSPFALLPSSPFYPAAFVASLPNGNPTLPVRVAYRTVELGPRTDDATTDQWRAITGLQGAIAGWDYQLSANYTANHQVDTFVSGYASETRLNRLLSTGTLNPFGPNSDAVLAQMRTTQITGDANDNRASNCGADFKVSGSVYTLPSGPLALAVGLEGRREKLALSNADFFASGDVMGGAGQVPSLPEGHRTVWSSFAEINVPVIASLEVDVAARYDHYSDFGGTTNPKVTLRWQPARPLLLRAAVDTGFRAPTLSDLFQPQVVQPEGAGEYSDPVRCPVTGSDVDCNALFGLKFGGIQPCSRTIRDN